MTPCRPANVPAVFRFIKVFWFTPAVAGPTARPAPRRHGDTASTMDKDSRNMSRRLFGLTLEFIYLLTGEDYMVVKECGELVARRVSHTTPHGTDSLNFAAAELKFLSHDMKSDRKVLKLSSKIIHLLTGEVRKFVGYTDSNNGDSPEVSQPAPPRDGSSTRKEPSQRRRSPFYSRDSAQEHLKTQRHFQEVSINVDIGEDDVRTERLCKEEDIPPEISPGDGGCVQVKEEEEEIPPEISPDGSRNRNPARRSTGPLYSWDCAEEKHSIPHDYQAADEDVKVVFISQSEDEDDGSDVKIEEAGAGTSTGELHGLQPDTSSGSNRPSTPPTCSSNEVATQEEKSNICSICNKPTISTANPQEDDVSTSLPEVCECKKTSRYRPYCCVKCGKSFSNKLVYVAHQRVHLVDQYFPCGKCGMTFPSKSILESHQSIHTGERPFSCFLCGKCFAMKANLVKHLKTHRSEKPFSCQECGKNFRLKHLLLKHLQVHTGEKPFACSHCGKKFGVKFNLVMHERIHTGEKPFKCLECGKCFASRSNLTTHERVHTGEKPFTCTFCGKGFITTSDLSRHQKIHTEGGPFICPDCGKTFISKLILNSHQKSHPRIKPPLAPEFVPEGLDNC